MGTDMDAADAIAEMEGDSAQISKVRSPAPQLHDGRYAVVDEHSSHQAKTGVEDNAAALTAVET
jgi:hypothetical protein